MAKDRLDDEPRRSPAVRDLNGPGPESVVRPYGALPAGPASTPRDGSPPTAAFSGPATAPDDGPRQWDGPNGHTTTPPSIAPSDPAPSSTGIREGGAAAPTAAPPALRRRSPGRTPGGPPERAERRPGEVKVVVWGATHSGKSTFLLALPRSASEQGWTIDTPTDKAGPKNFLNKSKSEFTVQKLLPFPTDDETEIVWELRRSSQKAGRFWRRGKRGAVVTIETIDRPGGHYREARETAVRQLAEADGIVYLFDPEAELQFMEDRGPGGIEFFTDCLTELRQRAYRAGRMQEGKLLHHVAVCMTKFDAPRIFNMANEGHFVTQDEAFPGMPRVRDARKFFTWACPRLGDSARLVNQDILVNFIPERVHHFVCSSIGFRTGPDGHFDPLSAEIDNLRPEAVPAVPPSPENPLGSPAQPGMHSIPYPINVLEPFVALARSLGSVSR